MTETQREFSKIALHEASHAITALALGFSVRQIDLRIIAGAISGTTHVRFTPGAKRSRRAAVLLAGSLGANMFRHRRLTVLPISTMPCQRPTPRHERREAQAVERFRFDQTAEQSGSLWTGDLGGIEELLCGCRNRAIIEGRAHRLVQRALSVNDRIVVRLAQLLLICNQLCGEQLQELGREVIRIDTQNRDIGL